VLKPAIKRVKGSWNNPNVQEFRRKNNIDAKGMGIIIQTMVYGDKNDNSCTGVAFSRNPNTGEKKMFGNFKVKAQGKEIVSGISSGEPIENLKVKFPGHFEILYEALQRLEREAEKPQEIEFTAEDGVLYFLQTRDIKFARKLFKVKDGVKKEFICKGLTSIPGAMFGRLAFNTSKADKFSKGSIIFVSTIKNRDEIIENITKFSKVGLITVGYGSDSCHEAVQMRAAGIPAVLNAQNIRVDLFSWQLTYGDKVIKESDYLVVDGNSNAVFITDEKDILIEDKITQDETFGIDIAEFREELKRPYLERIRGLTEPIEKKAFYEELLRECVEAREKFREDGIADKGAAFITNMKERFLNELLIEAAKLIGKNEVEARRELAEAVFSRIKSQYADSSDLFGIGIKYKDEERVILALPEWFEAGPPDIQRKINEDKVEPPYSQPLKETITP